MEDINREIEKHCQALDDTLCALILDTQEALGKALNVPEDKIWVYPYWRLVPIEGSIYTHGDRLYEFTAVVNIVLADIKYATTGIRRCMTSIEIGRFLCDWVRQVCTKVDFFIWHDIPNQNPQ